MASDLTFAVIFKAIDQLSDTVSRMGQGVGEFSNRIQEAGSRLSEWGERLALGGIFMREGAEQMSELADKITEPALAMERQLATAAAMSDLSAAAIKNLKERAIEFSNTHPGVTAEEYVDGFTRMNEVFQDANKALAAEDIAGKLSRFGVDGSAAVDLMKVAYANLHAPASQTGDDLLRTIQLFGMAPESAARFTMALGRMGGLAQQTHTQMSELFALMGEASQLMPSRGGMIFQSLIGELVQASAEGKNALDFTHGLAGGLEQLNRSLAGMGTAEKLAALKDLGVGANGAALLQLLDHLKDIAAAQSKIGDSAGALDKAYGAATKNDADQVALLHQNLVNLYDAMSAPALPWFNQRIAEMTGLVERLGNWAETHPGLGGKFVEGLTATSTVAMFAVHSMTTLGASAIFVGKSFEVFAAIPSAISSIAQATRLWTGAQWLLDAAMTANPIGLIIAGVAALAIGIYELWKHCESFRNFFLKMIPEAAQWGWSIMKSFGDGILSMVAWPVHAIEHVASKIEGFLHMHSPAKEGPLSQVHRWGIIETLVRDLEPAPVLAAINRVAMVTAVAAPMMLGGAGLAHAGQNGGIVINAPVTINGAGLDEKALMRVLEKHAYDLKRIVDNQTATRARASF